MKSLIPFLCVLVVLSGCVDYDGSFRAKETLKLKHTTIFGRTKTRTLNAGQYKTSFEVTAGKKLKFTFRGNNTVDVKMKLPRNIDLPNSDGSFFFMAEETGQNYDIKGDLQTDYSSSGIISGVESCSYTRYERRCEPVCSGSIRPSCSMVCTNVPVTFYGRRNARYRINYTKKSLHLAMNKPKSDILVATYSGYNQSSYRTYEYRGVCR